MANQVESTVGTCKWRLDGRCFRRLKCRHPVTKGNCASVGYGRLPTAPELLDHIRKNGSGEEVPRCDAVAGAPCPFVPSFDSHTLALSFRGKVVWRFKRRSRQTELLEAFDLAGWPDSLLEPLAEATQYDAENGLSDIVYELNEKLRRRIIFWCDGPSVCWKIVDNEPASR